MKAIIYAGTQVLTGDDIALAVMRYSGALAEAGMAETIAVPMIEADGSRGSVMILVGPASQIVAKDADIGGEELIDLQTVEELNAKIRRLHPVAVTDSGPPPSIGWAEEL